MEEKLFPKNGTAIAEEISRREEHCYRERIAEAARLALESDTRFLFLAGPSCSGKTTTSLSLVRALEEGGKRAMTFSTDDFFFNGDKAPKNADGTPNYDAFEHTDSRYIISVLHRLHQKEDALLPVFDFGTGCRSDRVVPLSAADYDVFILEGIHALNDVILGALPEDAKKLAVYLDVTKSIGLEGESVVLSPTEIRFCRRLIRDFKHRFASAERTFSLWTNVLASEKEILHPFRQGADFVIETNFTYEIPVEKEEAVRLLEEVAPSSPHREKADRLKEKLLLFPSLSKELVPKNSVLREFID